METKPALPTSDPVETRLTNQEFRGKVQALEQAMLKMAEHQIQIETRHYFSPGLYIREILVPKGATLVGKIQKTEYLNIISQGDISVMTEAGFKRSKAPAVLRSKPALKRAGYAHEDSVWVTVHENPTNERSIEVLEQMLFADSFDEVPEVMSTSEESPVVTLQGRPKDYDKKYLASERALDDVLSSLGMTHEQMRLTSEKTEDQIPFPSECKGIVIAESSVHGKGVFSTTSFSPGDLLAPARVGGKRTPAGRYGNHGARPNSAMVMKENGDVDLIATQEISPGEEILSDYFLNVTNSRFDQLVGKDD